MEMSAVTDKIGDVTKDRIRDQIVYLRDAVEESETNALRLFNGRNDQQTRSYLEGDAYEIEQRAERLVQNLRHLASEADEDIVGDEDAD
jgi:hypothetical protein